MGNYVVNKHGDHEVHNLSENCGHLPDLINQHSLGWHSSDGDAMQAARKVYENADACWYCMDRRYHSK